MPASLDLIHVVRRYGPVGGMERYVWELTRELQALGHRVTVICERCHADKPEGIAVVEIGEIAPKPRWLSLLRFGWRAAKSYRTIARQGSLVHSHERLGFHHLTTFHGPPFATIFLKPWWRWISLRVVMQLHLERRELSTPMIVVPNSELIKAQLSHFYPIWKSKYTDPVTPGVRTGRQRLFRLVPQTGGTVGFVGIEWQRKGLPLAVRIISELRRRRPKLQFCVIGPKPNDINHLFSEWDGGYQLAGWSDAVEFADFDVLLHPARAEPYGMVITEAMAAKVPVVVSDACGAANHVSGAAGEVVPIAAELKMWVDAIERQLARKTEVPEFERSWHQVAQDYQQIYYQLQSRAGL